MPLYNNRIGMDFAICSSWVSYNVTEYTCAYMRRVERLASTAMSAGLYTISKNTDPLYIGNYDMKYTWDSLDVNMKRARYLTENTAYSIKIYVYVMPFIGDGEAHIAKQLYYLILTFLQYVNHPTPLIF